MNLQKARFFDTQVYTSWAATDYTGPELRKIDRMIRAAGLRKGMRVLEPGCGTGRLTRILSDVVGPSGNVVAIDSSAEMAASCSGRVRNKKNVRVVRAALEDYPLPRNSFDVALCHNVFPQFDDKLRAAQVLADLLAESGKLIIYHFLNFEQINDPARKISRVVMRDLLPCYPTMRAILGSAGLVIERLTDDANGYFLSARVSESAALWRSASIAAIA